MRSALLAIGCMLLLGSAAAGGQVNNILTLAPGLKLTMPDDNSVPKESLLLYGANAAYKRFFIPHLSGQLRLGLWYGSAMDSIDESNKPQIDVREAIVMVPITAGLNLEMLPDRFFNPYLGAGVGADYVSLNWSAAIDGEDDKSGASSDVGLALYGVLGFDCLITDAFGMGVDLSYNYAPAVDFAGYKRTLHNFAGLLNFNFAF